MSHEGLTRMTKVEVVVAGADASAVADQFKSSGATGYTTASGVSGLGHGGYHQGRLLFNDQAALELLITVVPSERAQGLIDGCGGTIRHRRGGERLRRRGDSNPPRPLTL